MATDHNSHPRKMLVNGESNEGRAHVLSEKKAAVVALTPKSDRHAGKAPVHIKFKQLCECVLFSSLEGKGSA